MKLVNFENPVTNDWLIREGHRLDAPPFLSGAVEAKIALEKIEVPKQKLSEVTQAIYHAGRESRKWVTDRAHGVPFLSSTDILAADLSTLPLISKKQVERNPRFTIHEGWTLITRSGTVGRMAYARPEMDGMACSEHVLRVVPDSKVILSGYLYAYLSSKYGKTLVTSGTYGAIIQHIEPDHIADLPVPRLGAELEGEVHELVRAAGRLRSEANSQYAQAIETLTRELVLNDLPKKKSCTTFVASAKIQKRFDAYYFSDYNNQAAVDFENSVASSVSLGEVASVFIPGIFKRLYASDASFGAPYVTGNSVFQMAPEYDSFLMKRVVEENQLELNKGMIVVQEAGQVGGLLGRSVFVGERLSGLACSNNMVRVKSHDESDAGYLYALLRSEHGYRLLSRESAGSSIPHLEAGRVRNIRIPWPDKETRQRIGLGVDDATEKIDKGLALEKKAQFLVEQAIEAHSHSRG